MPVVPVRVEARFYETAEWDTAMCRLCPQLCSIAPSRPGGCGVRVNRHGVLRADNYGKIAELRYAPSAELPLFHHAPDATWLLLGMKGCTMRCPFCNTFQYSQVGGVRTEVFAPEEIVEMALEHKARGVSFGINEPAVSHEFVYDVFIAAREAGLETHLATSGSWCEEPFTEMVEVTTAMTLGFKGFSEHFIQTVCGGPVDFIKLNAEIASARGVRLEVSYLVLDGQEDWREQLDAFGQWIEQLDRSMPVMLMGLEPAFTWKETRTQPESLGWAFDRLRERLPHVYVVDPNGGRMDTYCPECNTVLVRRGLAGTIVRDLKSCPKCGKPAPFTG